MTFQGQMDGCIVFRRSKSIGNEVSNMIIPYFYFFRTFQLNYIFKLFKLAKRPIWSLFFFCQFSISLIVHHKAPKKTYFGKFGGGCRFTLASHWSIRVTIGIRVRSWVTGHPVGEMHLWYQFQHKREIMKYCES